MQEWLAKFFSLSSLAQSLSQSVCESFFPVPAEKYKVAKSWYKCIDRRVQWRNFLYLSVSQFEKETKKRAAWGNHANLHNSSLSLCVQTRYFCTNVICANHTHTHSQGRKINQSNVRSEQILLLKAIFMQNHAWENSCVVVVTSKKWVKKKILSP